MARNLTLTFLFLIIHTAAGNATEPEQRGLINKIRDEIVDSVLYFTHILEGLNNEYFAKSAFGKYINYDQIKPRLYSTGLEESRGMKKMAMGMMPLIFHVGATSTWMILTTILAAKSVFIGIILLVCKIAVSAAKIGSFFTTLKAHSGQGHHHEWAWSPPHEHHGPVYELGHGWGETSHKSMPTEYSEYQVDKKSRIG
ncbi:unnamed protein product [Pieris brassicae]|uniref:Uncharacterized protein n=1 Tax=Pieris brassicae TaxID=7116 RepID=A0A9P0TJI3_PIEBR|nr:unnamed protein product [Pieris brassicae]